MRTFLLIASTAVFFACNDKNTPRTVLPPEKMQLVLWDLMYADEVVNYRKLRDSSYQSLSKPVSIYDSVLNIHNITKEQLKKSIRYYESRPDLMRMILDSIQRQADQNSTSSFVQ